MAVIGTDGRIEKRRELGVGVAEPTAVRDSVSYVIESLGVELREILEGVFLKDLRVERRNTVY